MVKRQRGVWSTTERSRFCVASRRNKVSCGDILWNTTRCVNMELGAVRK